MEMQDCVHQYAYAANDGTIARYHQGITGSQTGSSKKGSANMRILFSGYGQADQNMGAVPMPALHPFKIQFPNH